MNLQENNFEADELDGALPKGIAEEEHISFAVRDEPAPRRGWKKRDKIILVVVILILAFAVFFGYNIYLLATMEELPASAAILQNITN